MSTPGDRQAFPLSGQQDGMTLRQYLAGQALAGLCASDVIAADAKKECDENDKLMPDLYAAMAVKVADATLKELAKEGR